LFEVIRARIPTVNPNAVEAAEILPLLMAREFLWVLLGQVLQGMEQIPMKEVVADLCPVINGYNVERFSAQSRGWG
tara:strand:+ start:47 stop:274 length:228 start_codon:yes stop_codon:yes gene_type:complete